MNNTCGITDGETCSICCENYKIPMYRPCKHSFCHGCLYSYIASHFNSTESRLGFHCPICSEYILYTNANQSRRMGQVFSWEFYSSKMGTKFFEVFCEGCLRESKEYAAHFCLNCQEKMYKNCVKYHKRGQLTRNH